MKKRQLGLTDIEIVPLVLGGNVFGWTIDEKMSFSILDAFVDRGFDAVDTADVYSSWVAGNKGGESETIIGNWLKANPQKREKIFIFSKVGSDMGQAGHKGLKERWIMQAVEDSLQRLQTDYIDLYFSHWPDADTPYEETLGAYSKLLKAGKIRAIGASNLNLEQLMQAEQVAKDKGLPQYDVLEPEYNLYDRSAFDGPLRDFCEDKEMGVITYYSLASGFLSGKYRSKEDLNKSKRGADIEKYLTPRGMKILNALDQVSGTHSAKPAEVALAWLIAQKGVSAPIASATSIAQVDSFVNATKLSLTTDDLAILDVASSY